MDIDNPQEYTFYLRADMGLSATFDISATSKLIITTEVLNVFNQYNYAGYEWIRVFNNSRGLVNIPEILSKRFFNLKVEYHF